MKSVLVVSLLFAQGVVAQPVRNAVERANDRRALRRDLRQGVDDRIDLAQARALLEQYDHALAAGNVSQLQTVEAAFQRYLAQELAESRVEQAQAQHEVRQDKRELRSDRREVRRDVATGRAAVVDDVHDRNTDRRNLVDDRADAATERVSRQRLSAIASQTAALGNRFDGNAVQEKRALFAEAVGAATNEVHRDEHERREDKRELREDRRETREDRLRR